MEKPNDIFGQALYSYWIGDRDIHHILRRDDGYGGKTDIGSYFDPEYFPDEDPVLSAARGKILDVGCGAGRFLLYFQKLGFDITGIDISPGAIAVCRERGCREVRLMDIFQPEFAPASFDTILLFGHNIGIGGTLTGAEKLLQILRLLIRPGGALLLNSLDPTAMEERYHQADHLVYKAEDGYLGSIKFRVEYKDRIGDWFNWVHLDSGVLRQLAEKTNWQVERLCESRQGDYSAVLRAR
ncbi:class I SAM-dependent methyltransferase [Flavilitoribacter nigricans]|uniref:class I SAM-dependent methyltransferase n=1 Tax=Flavilitoribacter nigricans TaxID=70997 RepID=UPI001474D45E|nr:class I SAM-dependent methyltransferase [Flavilitoribacter nigricans]